MGVENHDKRAWVDGVLQMKHDQRTMATNVTASSITALTFLSSVSLTLCSLIGAWIANTYGSKIFQGTPPPPRETSCVKYTGLLACFVLAFAFFLQSAINFIYASYLVSTKESSVHADDVKTVMIRGGEFWSLGLRAIYFALTLLLWFLRPDPNVSLFSDPINAVLPPPHTLHSPEEALAS